MAVSRHAVSRKPCGFRGSQAQFPQPRNRQFSTSIRETAKPIRVFGPAIRETAEIGQIGLTPRVNKGGDRSRSMRKPRLRKSSPAFLRPGIQICRRSCLPAASRHGWRAAAYLERLASCRSSGGHLLGPTLPLAHLMAPNQACCNAALRQFGQPRIVARNRGSALASLQKAVGAPQKTLA